MNTPNKQAEIEIWGSQMKSSERVIKLRKAEHQGNICCKGCYEIGIKEGRRNRDAEVFGLGTSHRYCVEKIKELEKTKAQTLADVIKELDTILLEQRFVIPKNKIEELKAKLQSPQLKKPTGFNSSSCLRREHNSRVIGTQNSLGEKSAVSPEDTIQKAISEFKEKIIGTIRQRKFCNMQRELQLIAEIEKTAQEIK